MELPNDYDLDIQYHPGRINTVVAALSKKMLVKVNCLLTQQEQLIEEMECLELSVILSMTEDVGCLGQMIVQYNLKSKITKALLRDPDFMKIIDLVRIGHEEDFTINENDLLWYKGRVYVSNVNDLRRDVFYEAHHFGYTIHLDSKKMYQDLNGLF